MSEKNVITSSIPTNIITGFLGVGKTTAIMHLLASKPTDERWAVLVNEFGEIGVDGHLFAGNHTQAQGVFVKEVPGGCMCCAAGLPMQVALNQLLTQAQPDRLLIEPTGLGHPKEVVQVLSEAHYKNVLSLQHIITLVDARKLSDTRYTEHDTFNQQISIADAVVGNKVDLYSEEDKTQLNAYVKKHGVEGAQVVFSEQGNIPLTLLSGPMKTQHAHNHHHHSHENKPSLSETPLPECGYIKAENEGEGFFSVGWRFSPRFDFDHDALFAFLSGIDAERMKAVFITTEGVFAYNLTTDALTEIELDECYESRIEIISTNLDRNWEDKLLMCIAEHSPSPILSAHVVQ